MKNVPPHVQAARKAEEIRKKLGDWLDENRADLENLRMESAIFYSDSINDLALMEVVAEPVAVDPDSSLEQVAMSKKWQIISLR